MEIILTDQQKSDIKANAQSMSLLAITRYVFKNEALDNTSAEYKEVRRFIAEGDNTKIPPKDKPPFVLTDAYKATIKSMLEKNDSPMNIAKVILNLDKVAPLSKEYKIIYAFCKSLDNSSDMDIADEPVDSKEYKSPTHLTHVVAKVNEYVLTGDPKKNAFDYDNLKPREDKQLRALWTYLKSPKFVYQACTYDKKIDRTLFESEFIRFTYNKDDLNFEEQNQYISLAAEIVSEMMTNRVLSLIQSQLEESLKASDEDKKKYSVSLAENLGQLRQKAEQSKKRQESLFTELTESRAERVKGKENRTRNVLFLLEAWQEPESRKQLIALGELEKKEDQDITNALESMEDVNILLAGVTKEEYYN